MSIELSSVTVDLPIYSVKSRSFRRTVASNIGGKLYRRGDDVVTVRALSNVSVKIGDHERVAIVGPNGAGKSTLLKVLAGVYTPSSGVVSVRGNVSAALNVGLGLDTELSGRENVYLLGYYRRIPREVIDAHIQGIVDSTELGDFIDLPMHTYSAGMHGRLTFAVATAFDPDVLLMDEWLMAGDLRFMHKAAQRVSEFISKARVMVLASHSLGVVREFCTKAIYLQGGELVAYGTVDEVIAQYQEDERRQDSGAPA